MGSNNKPLVSVYILCYNHENYIAQSIESVLNQTYSHIELIIVDNASTDKSSSIIETYIKLDTRIKFYPLEVNTYPSYGSNYAIKQCHGEYICGLSSDDYFELTKIESQLNYMQLNNYTNSFTWVNVVNDNSQILMETSVEKLFNQSYSPQDIIENFIYHKNVLCAITYMFHRSYYDKYGYYDNRLLQSQDHDLFLRIMKHEDIHVYEKKLTNYRVRDDQKNLSVNMDSSALHRSIMESIYFGEHVLDFKLANLSEIIGVLCTKENKYTILFQFYKEHEQPIFASSILFAMYKELGSDFSFPSSLYSDFFAIYSNYDVLNIMNLKEKNKIITKKDSQIIELNKQVNLKDTQVIELNKQVNLKDTQVIELNKQVNLKDTQVIELNKQVNLKDTQVIELNDLAHTQQDMIHTMTQTIETLNTQIDTLNIQLQEDIDISIVTFNSKKWADAFFESLLQQDYPLDKLHLYITDNSSTDDTYTYLQSLGENYSQIFGSFDLRQEKNLGFGFGHNNNFKRSHSKFVLTTNIDLQFEKDAIVNLLNYAQNDEKSTASWEMRQKPYEHPKYYNPVTLETTWSSSACILFRKEAIDTIGGYDDHIFMYGEDVELSYRLRDNGYKLKYYPKAVCWHYTYAEAGEIKEVQYFGSTIANILIRMRYGSKADVKEGLRMYKGLLNAQGLIYNQRRKQLVYLLNLIYKAPFFLFNRKKRRDITYKFLNWDYEFIRDGAFYTYTEERLVQTPLVSIIMRTCCERNEFLKEAIQSVINQTYTNIELIIVEDGTRNATNLIESLHAENLTNIIYKPIEKAGRCHAGNEGLASASGKYMIFLDDDDLFFADHLEILVQELENNPDISACYSSSFEVKTDIISKTPLHYEEKEFNIIHKEEFSRETMLHHNFIPIQSILFKRDLYLQYGGFDEDLDNLEDWNLWTRYSYLNDFKFVNKTTSLYRVPACPDSSAGRQKELDKYYQMALKKQQAFINTLNIKQ